MYRYPNQGYDYMPYGYYGMPYPCPPVSFVYPVDPYMMYWSPEYMNSAVRPCLKKPHKKVSLNRGGNFESCDKKNTKGTYFNSEDFQDLKMRTVDISEIRD